MKLAAIKEHHLYNKAYSRGDRATGKTVSVYILRDYAARRLAKAHPQHKTVNRIGIAVSKKIGGACVRNRAKRIIREAYRAISREGQIKVGFLVVIAARPDIVGVKTADVEAGLRRAFRKMKFYCAPLSDGSATHGIDS